MITSPSKRLHNALEILLPNQDMVDYVWDHHADALNMDRFLDPKSSFLQLCLNVGNQMDLFPERIHTIKNAIHELVIALTNSNCHSEIWNVWNETTTHTTHTANAVSCINEWSKEIIIKNIDGIQRFIKSPSDWHKHDNLMTYAVPLLDGKMQQRIWHNISQEEYEEPLIPIGQLGPMYEQAPTPRYQQLILDHITYEFGKQNHNDVHPLLHGMNDPQAVNVPKPIVNAIMNTIKEDEIIKYLESSSQIARVHTGWPKDAWKILNKPFTATLHTTFEERFLDKICNLQITRKKTDALDFWTQYDGLVLLPNITKWCLEHYNENMYYPDASLHFAAYVHGLKPALTGNAWLITYFTRQSYDDITGYRDWCLQQYKEETIIKWLNYFTEYGCSDSNALDTSSLCIGENALNLNYTPGDLIHPDEWKEALAQQKTNVADIEMRILLKRWFVDADFELVDELKRLKSIYSPMMDMNSKNTWMLMFDQLHNQRAGFTRPALKLDLPC